MDLQRGTAAAAELGGGRHVHQPMLHSTFLDRTASVFVQCSYAFGRSVRRSQTWELPTQHFEYDAFHLDVLTSAEHDEGSLLLDWQNKMTGQRPTSFRYVMRPDGYLFQ